MYIVFGEVAYNFDQVINIQKTGDGSPGWYIELKYQGYTELIRFSSKAARDVAFIKLLKMLNTKYFEI